MTFKYKVKSPKNSSIFTFVICKQQNKTANSSDHYKVWLRFPRLTNLSYWPIEDCKQLNQDTDV